jgi:hypothetical protein
MAISELSIEDKELMKDITDQLLKTIELKESLFDELSPLTEELSELKKEEEELSIQYESISNVTSKGYSKEDAKKLKESSDRIYEIAKRKQELEIEIRKLKAKINPVISDEQDLQDEVHRIKNKSNDKIEIKEDGVIIDKIVVKESKISNLSDNIKINKDKNIIINTQKNVANFIKSNYEKAKNIEINPGKKLKESLNKFYTTHIKNKVDEFVSEFKAGYESVRDEAIKDKIDEILEQRQNLKKEAENLEFAKNETKELEKEEKVVVEAKKENTNNNPLLIEDQSVNEGLVFVEEPEENEVLDKNNIEVKEAIEVPSNVVEPIEQKEEKSNDNVFVSTPILEDKKTEVEQVINEEVKKYNGIDHFIKSASNKVAKTTKSKVEAMINIFNGIPSSIGKVVGDVKNNIDTKQAISEKKKEIYDLYQEQKKNLQEVQMKQMQELNDQYANNMDDMENIFASTAILR